MNPFSYIFIWSLCLTISKSLIIFLFPFFDFVFKTYIFNPIIPILRSNSVFNNLLSLPLPSWKGWMLKYSYTKAAVLMIGLISSFNLNQFTKLFIESSVAKPGSVVLKIIWVDPSGNDAWTALECFLYCPLCHSSLSLILSSTLCRFFYCWLG